MIFTRYLAGQIYKGTALVLLILVSLSLFFTFVQKVDTVGTGNFGIWEFAQYLIFKIPLMIVDFMPLATLLGSILSMGNMASSSELIAIQSSGLSLKKFIISVIQISLILAIVSFIIADFVVPKSETYSKNIRESSMSLQASMLNKKGVWIKDEGNVLYVGQLFPDGNAKDIDIYQLDSNAGLQVTTTAAKAIMQSEGWVLHQVKQSIISKDGISVEQKDTMVYQGQLSKKLLESLVVSAQLMPTVDLHRYIGFLDDNSLSSNAVKLTFWQKIYSPLTIIVMCLLAIPFVMGSQRDSNTGQRVIIGIVLGLVFFILNRLLIQLGEQFQLYPALNALMPSAVFTLLTAFLIRRKAF